MSDRDVAERIQADWRKLPQPSEIVYGLLGLLTQIDAHGLLLKETSETSSYKFHDTVDVPHPAIINGVATMIAKWNNPVKKTVLDDTVCCYVHPCFYDANIWSY